jgi:hypothetical protein
MSQLSKRAEAIILEMGEEDARKKEKEKEAEASKKEKELNEAENVKKKEEEEQKEFGEKFGKYFGEHSKDMNDRMCVLEESMKSVVAMSEKMIASKKEGE